MLRTLVAFVLGSAVVVGAGYGWFRVSAVNCLGRCAGGTRCEAGHCVAVTVPPAAAAPTLGPARKKLGPRTGVYSGSKGLVILRPGDDQMGSAGDLLGRPERVDMTRPGDDGKELDQADIDNTFRAVQPAISQCIATAIGDIPLNTGTVDVGFRIERGGDVSRTHLDAPRVLLQQGLMDCVRPLVAKLKFPKSGGSNVVNYPFQIK